MGPHDAAGFRLRDLFLHGAEPPPAAVLVRQPYHVWLIVGVVSIGAFMSQIDASIVQLTLPALSHSFDASMNGVRWVAIAYLLSAMAFIPVFARLCELYGRKLLYLVGFTVFMVSSFLCGVATDLPTLVAFRALQGFGGAMIGANSLSILMKSVDGERRAQAIGIFTAAQAVGISLGPVVGGVLLERLGWQWVFWVNVPFCVIAVIVGWMVLHRTAELPADKSFDWAGVWLLTPSLGLTILALNQVSVWPLLSLPMILCVAAAATFLVVFVRRELALTRPLVDVRLFGVTEFAAGAVCGLLSFGMLYGVFFAMSFALIHGFHDSPGDAGLRLALVPVAIGVMAPVSVALSKRFGVHRIGIVGMACCAVALGALAVLMLRAGPHDYLRLATFVLFGAGLGLFITPNNNATLDAAPAKHAGQAGATVILARTFGSCAGVSVVSSVMAWGAERASGGGADLLFRGQPLLAGVEAALAVLVVVAVVTGALSLMRGTRV